MEVRVDVLRPMGRRAASNDDVVPKSKNKAHQSLSRRTNTALAKSSGPSPANLTSSRTKGGFDESGRETEEEEDEDEEGASMHNTSSRSHHPPSRHGDHDDDEEEGEEESGDGGSGGNHALRMSDPRLASLHRNRVASLPPTQSASELAVAHAAAIPRHLLLRQRSESHPPDRFRPTARRSAQQNHHQGGGGDDGNGESTQSDDYEIDDEDDEEGYASVENEAADEDDDHGGEEEENENENEMGNESGTRRTPRRSALSPRRLYTVQAPDLDFGIVSASGPSNSSSTTTSSSSSSSSSTTTKSSSRSPSSSSSSSRAPRSITATSPPVSPSSSPPQPTYTNPPVGPPPAGLYPRTNSFGTMSPRKANARRLLMSTSLSSSAIMKAPPLSPSATPPGTMTKRTSSSSSLQLASPSRRITSVSQPVAVLPTLNFDDPTPIEQDVRSVKDRRMSSSVNEYEFEFRAVEMGWHTRDDPSRSDRPPAAGRTRNSLRSSDEDTLGGTTSTSTSSSSAPFSPKHSRSRSINRLSCSAQLHPGGSTLRNAISPRALPSLSLSSSLQSTSATDSPTGSPRSPGHSPLSSPKAIPTTTTVRHHPGSPLSLSPGTSCSPPSPMMPAPTPATTPSSSASSTSLATRTDAFNSHARTFKSLPAYGSGSGSEESEEGESLSSSQSRQLGTERRRRGGGSGITRGGYRDSDGSGGSSESDYYRESESDDTKGEGSGGETGGTGGGGPFLYRADSLGTSDSFKPRKSLFADPKKRYKSHTLHHHRSPRGLSQAANYNSMGIVAVPPHRMGRQSIGDDIQAMHAKEERRRAKAAAQADGAKPTRKYGSDGESSSSTSSSAAASSSPSSPKPRPISMRASTSTAASGVVSPRSKRYSLESPGRIAKTVRSDEERKESKERLKAEREKDKEKDKEKNEKEKEKKGGSGIIRMSKELKQEIEQKGGVTKRALRSSSGVAEGGVGGNGAESEAVETAGAGGGGEKQPQDNLLRRIQAFRQHKGKTFHTLPSLSEAKASSRDSSPRDNNVIRRKNSKDRNAGDEPTAASTSADVSGSTNDHQVVPETADVVAAEVEPKRRERKASRDGTATADVSSSSNERKHKMGLFSFVSLPRKAGRGKKASGKGSSKDLTPPSLAVTPRSPRIAHLDSSSGSHPIAARRRRRERMSRAADRRRRRSTSLLACEFRIHAALSLPTTTHSTTSTPSVASPPCSPRPVGGGADVSRGSVPSIGSPLLARDERRRLLRTKSVDERLLCYPREFDDLLGADGDGGEPPSGEHHHQYYDGSSSGDRTSEGHSAEVDNHGSGGSDGAERRDLAKPQGVAPGKRSNKVRGRAGPVHSPKLSKKNAGGKGGKSKQQNAVRQKDMEDNRFLTAENFDQLLVNRDLLLAELVKPGLRLIRGLLSVVSATTEDDPDALCQALVAIADRYGQITQLMKLAIAQELNSTTSPFTLFREDSLGTKFLSTYAREKGGAYLASVLKPVIKKVVTSHTSYEMDPLRIPQDPKATPRDENQRKLEKLCQHVLDAIFSRQSDFPLQIISSYLYAEVNLKFPFDTTRPRAWSQEGDEEVEDGLAFHRSSDWGLAYVGAFIFLRFFCPAIVSPKPHGIVKRSPTREAQRGLMLVAKTLQTMANQLRFGDKEPYMKPMNQFIEDNQLSLENYLRTLTQKPPKLQSQTRFVAPEKEKKTMRDKFSSSSTSSLSSSLLNLSSAAAAGASFAERSSAALAHSSAADPGDEESAQLAVVQSCCTRNQRKLLTFYYSSSLPFLSAIPNSASSSGASSPNNSPSSSAPPTPSSSAPPTPSSRSVSPRTGTLANLAPQANAALHSGSSPRMKSEE